MFQRHRLPLLTMFLITACSEEPTPRAPLPGMSTPCVEGDLREECGEQVAPPSFEELLTTLRADCAPADEGIDADTGYHRWSWGFTLPAGATSFIAAPLTTRGKLLARSLQTPDTLVDLVSDYRHHNTNTAEAGRADAQERRGTYDMVSLSWPVLFPYAPQHAGLVVAGGAYTLRALTQAATPPCLLISSDTARTTRLKLNVYLVGIEGISAEDAAQDAALKALTAALRAIFAQRGVVLDDLRYLDAPQAASGYAVLRDAESHIGLTAFGRAPRTLDEAMSIDVFMVRDIMYEAPENLLRGLSGSLPGVPGLHGNVRDGLVFNGALLGADTDALAAIMAHELGHFLGLRHTTETSFGMGGMVEEQLEQTFGLTDPIEDTPTCSNLVNRMEECPDSDNLMFPFYIQQGRPQLTEGQGFVLLAHPLTRAEVIR